VLFLHRIDQTRVTKTLGEHLDTFVKVCGVANMKSVVFVTTMWDGHSLPASEEMQEIFSKRDHQLKDQYLHGLKGCKTARFQQNTEVAWNIIESVPSGECNLTRSKKPKPVQAVRLVLNFRKFFGK
jgi:hypothetical protein